MRLALLFPFALGFIALPAFADVDRALRDHILPGHEELARATDALASNAAADCSPATVRPAFHAAYDAWIAIGHIQFGPIEDQALTLAMSFWPDPKDSTGKALARLISNQDAIVDDRSAWPEVSAAAQGFTALERLLYEAQPDQAYACRLTRIVAAGLADKSADILRDWPEFASQMTTAGADGNTRFQSPIEAQRAVYTALSTGLEFLHDQRLGRPLGTFDRPRPRRAEARRSERSLRHIQLSLAALEDLAFTLSDGELADTRAAFAAARARADDLNDPTLASVADPGGRFRVELVQQAVRAVQIAVIDDIGKPLGISAGFNALDGD
ncbi:MAG: imelysin family protein [Pseudomonadota bacterium]